MCAAEYSTGKKVEERNKKGKGTEYIQTSF